MFITLEYVYSDPVDFVLKCSCVTTCLDLLLNFCGAIIKSLLMCAFELAIDNNNSNRTCFF